MKILRTRTKIEAVLACAFLIAVSVASVFAVTRTITDTGDTVDTYIRNSKGNYWAATYNNIQTAIDDLGSAGGWVKLPPGNFIVTKTIYINYTVILEGSGSGNKIWFSTGVTLLNVSTNTVDYVIRAGISTASTQYIQIKNLAIRNKGNYAQGGIKFLNVRNGKISDVQVAQFYTSSGGVGINITSAGSYGCYFNVLDNVFIFNCAKGLVIWGQSPSSYCNANYYISGAVGGDTGATYNGTGILIHNSDTNWFGAMDVEGWIKSGSRGIVIEGTGSSLNKFFGVRMENNNRSIVISGTGENYFFGLNTYSAVTDKIYLTDAGTGQSIFDNCQFGDSVIYTLPTDIPTTLIAGCVWFNATTGKLGIYTGTAWVWK